MDIIKTSKLTKYYGRNIGISKLTFEVRQGEVFGFIGPNGAGKTTTIRLLLDLIRPSSGSAEIFGLDINKHTIKIKKSIGYLPGEIFLPENMSGQACIDYYSHFKQSVDRRFLHKLVERFDFDGTKRISDYSKGNKQKLAIILALMHQPKLLILDEPTSGLDPLNQQEFYNLIRESQKAGATTFFSTHILEEAEKLCDRVGIIRAGELLQIENIDNFKDKNIREMKIETKAVIPSHLFDNPIVYKHEKTDYGYKVITKGHNGQFIQNISGLGIVDIKVSEPSLEEIFLHLYRK